MKCVFALVLTLINFSSVLGLWTQKVKDVLFIQKPDNDCKQKACRAVLDPWFEKTEKSRWPDEVYDETFEDWDGSNSTLVDGGRRLGNHCTPSFCNHGANCRICMSTRCNIECRRRLNVDMTTFEEHRNLGQHRQLGQCLNLYWEQILDRAEYRLRLADAVDLDPLPSDCQCDLDGIWYVENYEWVNEPSEKDGTPEAEAAEKAMLETLEFDAMKEYEVAKLEFERAEDVQKYAEETADKAADLAKNTGEDAQHAAETVGKKKEEADKKAAEADVAVADAVKANAYAEQTAASHATAEAEAVASEQVYAVATADYEAAKKAREQASKENEAALKWIEEEKKSAMENAKDAAELARKVANDAFEVAKKAADEARSKQEDSAKEAAEAAEKASIYEEAQQEADSLAQLLVYLTQASQEAAVVAAQAATDLLEAEQAMILAKENYEIAKKNSGR